MSKEMIIAFIGFAGAILGGAIVGFGSIAAAERKSESPISCGLLGLLASLGAAVGLVIGTIFGLVLIRKGDVSSIVSVTPDQSSLDTAPSSNNILPRPTSTPTQSSLHAENYATATAPTSSTVHYQPLIINGVNYPRPDPKIQPYCVAQEVHTQGENKVTYDVVVPKGWVMVWDSYKAYWPGGSYGDNGLLGIYGEWSGTIEINTGGSCSVPIEWVDFAIQNRRNDYPVSFRPEFFIGEVP